MSTYDRVYRAIQPSDIPKIQGGTLKAFYLYDLGFVVDVTPTKRYAIWSHKAQRFVNLDDVKSSYGNKADAEIAMEEMFKKYATSEKQQKQFYVVEWEIKDDNV